MGLEESLEESRRQCIELTRSLETERGARAQAERISQLKDEFLSTLSHELRTPLSAILGWTQILCAPDVTSDDLKEGLATIQRNARAQTQLIDDLQDIGRMISGRIRLDLQRVELAAVVRAAVAAVQRNAELRSIQIQTTIDPLAGVISGDPIRLQQIVWNLLSNAIKFTPAGGHIRLKLACAGSKLEMSVQDNGVGISAERLPWVFERFLQSDSSNRRRTGGLGVGLSLVRHLVELHSGTVRASSPGESQGATFIVTLPISAIFDEKTTSKNPAECGNFPIAGDQPILKGATILVVDDEPDARDMLRRVLERCQAKVFLASGGREAVELVQQKHPQLIVSDIGMPELDGYEMMRLIRALPLGSGGQTPAIALTAFARSEDRNRAILAGFQKHLKKPVETPELIASLASLLNG